MAIDLKGKFLGAVVGSALGDAIGEIAFHTPTREGLLRAIEHANELRYTDDTAMALGLAESIIRRKSVDPQDLGDTFRRNYEREPWRGYASGPPTIFSMVRSTGLSYVEAARHLFAGSGSLGNGAAMRIAPVGLFFHNSDRLYEEAAASAEVTHAHPVGKDGAAVLARAIAQAVKLDSAEKFPLESLGRGLVDFSRTDEIRKKTELVRELLREDISPDRATRRLGRSVAVHESMPFAVYSFLRHPKSFEECLFCSVLNGGDRDTLGAMACAISGAYLGTDAIPHRWREKLENRAIIEEMAVSLLEARTAPTLDP